jgi:predicted transcriptional regulator of viral defense system
VIKIEQQKEKLLRLAGKNGGVITTKIVTKMGISRSLLSLMVQQKELIKIERGIYILPNAVDDELFSLQNRFTRIIFSHETALFLNGYSDQTPLRYTVTVPKGYNSMNLLEICNVVQISMEFYSLGVETVKTMYGQKVKTYNIERTLCDMLRNGNDRNVQIILPALKKYVTDPKRDLLRLFKYARMLHVEAKIQHYMEILINL